MVGVAGHCKRCGMAFALPSFNAGQVGRISFANCMVNCPKCGEMAEIADGEYVAGVDGYSLVSGPPLTRQIVDALKSVVEKAKAENLSAAEILGAVGEVDKNLAERLQQKHGLPALVLLIVLIWLIKGVQLDIKLDVNRLIDQAVATSSAHPDPGTDFEIIDIPEEAIIPADEHPALPPFVRDQPNRRERRRRAAAEQKRPKRS